MNPSEEAARAAVQKIMPCECHEGYTSRNLTDPTCAWHRFGEDIADMIATAYRRALPVETGVTREELIEALKGALSKHEDGRHGCWFEFDKGKTKEHHKPPCLHYHARDVLARAVKP